MLVTRKSKFTGKTHAREVDVTQEQLKSWENGELAQRAFPQLSDADREFIMTGCTPEEWAEMFPPGDDD